MAFIQIIEFVTKRPDEIEALGETWRAETEGRRSATRIAFAADRDRPDTYVQIVEFPSAEDAAANSDLPETARLAEAIARLCEGPVTFRNLEVRGVEEI